jgi:hypothetical protein
MYSDVNNTPRLIMPHKIDMFNCRSNNDTKITIKKYQILIFFYIILSLMLYLSVSEHLIEEGSAQTLNEFFKNLSNDNDIGLHLWADSSTYTVLSKQYDFKDILLVLILHPNYLGPFIILKIFNSSELLIYLFNIIIFLFSVSILIKYYPVNKYKFVLLLCASPMLLSSLLAINKEIFAMLSISMFLVYVKKKKNIFLIVCILSAIITRWQLAVVMIILTMIFSKYNYFRHLRFTTVVICLASISIAYPMLTQTLFEREYTHALRGMTEWEGGGTGALAFMLKLQDKYCYFLVFLPKTIHLLVGNIAQFNIFKLINKIDFYNMFIVISQSLVYLFLLIQIIMKKKINIDNDIFYVALIFCIFTSMTPVIALRYFFPLHLLFSLMLSTRSFRKVKGVPNKFDTPQCQP